LYTEASSQTLCLRMGCLVMSAYESRIQRKLLTIDIVMEHIVA
jgi:hypothetical protein